MSRNWSVIISMLLVRGPIFAGLGMLAATLFPPFAMLSYIVAAIAGLGSVAETMGADRADAETDYEDFYSPRDVNFIVKFERLMAKGMRNTLEGIGNLFSRESKEVVEKVQKEDATSKPEVEVVQEIKQEEKKVNEINKPKQQEIKRVEHEMDEDMDQGPQR